MLGEDAPKQIAGNPAEASALREAPSPDDFQKRVFISGRSIRYLEAGRGPSLLLLPSATGRATEYLSLLPLLKQTFHLYALDYPGFGQSETLATVEEEGDLPGFVLAWMGALGLKQCHLAGFSMGGWIALALVLSNPERFSKLVLMATTAGELSGAPITSPDGLSFQESLEVFYHRPETKKRLAQKKLSAAEKEEIYRSSRAFSRLLQHMPAIPNFYDRLGEIKQPCLIIGSDQDRAIPLAHQKRLYEGISGAKLLVLKDTGHALPEERPEVLASAFSEFLSEKGECSG